MLTQKKLDEKYKQAAKRSKVQHRKGISNILIVPKADKSVIDYNKFKELPRRRT